MTIRSFLEKHAAEKPCVTALRYCGADKQWHDVSWASFLACVRTAAEGYATLFAPKPRVENVALMLGNGPVWMESYLALSGAGVSVVPIDPKLHNEEVLHILSDSGAVVLTTDEMHLPMVREIAVSLPILRGIVVADNAPTSYEPIGTAEVYSWCQLQTDYANVSAPCWYDQNVAQEGDVASVIYTSGTTGKPKGAMLTHGNFIADITGGLEAFGEKVTQEDSLLIVLPLFHAFSFCANFVLGVWLGLRMSFVRSLYTVGEDVKGEKPSIVMAVPLLAEKVFDRIDSNMKKSRLAKWALRLGLKCLVRRKVLQGLGGRLRFMIVGGAPCPPHVLQGYRKLGIAVLEGYGLTECSPIVSVAGTRLAKIGTIGVKIPNVEIRLADPNELGVGELQVRGPITMKGYWHNEAATAEAFEDGWLKTGDLASVDAETGLISIRGRKKALIVNREGKNIYPEEVENRIAADALLADCIVVGYTTGGIPGEKVGCVVHPNDDVLKVEFPGKVFDKGTLEKLVADRVHARCADLADYKRVRKVVVKSMPLERTSIQKVKRVVYKGTLDE